MKIYYRGSCASSKKALEWFRSHDIEIEVVKIREITHKDLIHVLSLSDNGVFDIVKRSSGPVSDENIKNREKINNMSFNEALVYLKKHPALLMTPIILEADRCLIGFNSEQIRQFFPIKYRKTLQ
ncbi:ArsC/Spx/MgsR family protein [Lactococcus garvieae]|uniref:ArsC/Spx/MgsR family protein n=1 Tax=Lactococcus garvieae TaxID=1363 RepID=UPI0009C17B66|nr:ArsC/Spx/MgsR family protein [Lactococcus garvieae]QPS70376.1 ArsR family transcriptional regulator [Lactococcus garvieae]